MLGSWRTFSTNWSMLTFFISLSQYAVAALFARFLAPCINLNCPPRARLAEGVMAALA